MKFVCSSKNCKYTTNVSERMETHKKKTGHDRIYREHRGHIASAHKKK